MVAASFETTFLPTNRPINIGVRTAYVDQIRFSVALDRDGGVPDILARQDVVTRRAICGDMLVKRHLIDVDQTIVTLTIPVRGRAFGKSPILICTLAVLLDRPHACRKSTSAPVTAESTGAGKGSRDYRFAEQRVTHAVRADMFSNEIAA
jgi:hypothetical protein